MSTAAVRFACPRCGKKPGFKQAPANGTKFVCPGCQGKVTYNSPEPDFGQPAFEPMNWAPTPAATQPKPSPSPKLNRPSKKPTWPVLVLLGTGLCGAAVLLTIWVGRGFNTTVQPAAAAPVPAAAAAPVPGAAAAPGLAAKRRQLVKELEELEKLHDKDAAWMAKLDEALAKAERTFNVHKDSEDPTKFVKASTEMNNLYTERSNVELRMLERVEIMKEKVDQLKSTTAEGAAELAKEKAVAAEEKAVEDRLEQIRRGQK
jgi:hypothetical protein